MILIIQGRNINYNVPYYYKGIVFGCALMSYCKKQVQANLLQTYFERSHSFIITSSIHI